MIFNGRRCAELQEAVLRDMHLFGLENATKPIKIVFFAVNYIFEFSVKSMDLRPSCTGGRIEDNVFGRHNFDSHGVELICQFSLNYMREVEKNKNGTHCKKKKYATFPNSL